MTVLAGQLSEQEKSEQQVQQIVAGARKQASLPQARPAGLERAWAPRQRVLALLGQARALSSDVFVLGAVELPARTFRQSCGETCPPALLQRHRCILPSTSHRRPLP